MGMESHVVVPAEDAQLQLVKKISALAAAIGELPSLSPSPEVNALFTELVISCIPASSVVVDELGPEEQEMRGRLIRLCADAEGQLEAYYSDKLSAFDDNPLDHLAVFPYFNNYIKLSQLEHALLARHVPGPPTFSRVAFLGSGPLPLSSIVLATRHLPAASFHNYDICAEANARARKLVRADADVAPRMAFHTADVAEVTDELGGYDVVFLAALVGMAKEEKARLVAHLGKHMAPGAALVVRSAHGARGFLYPVVDPEEIRRGGFEVLAVHHPEDEVINSVIIATRRCNSNDNLQLPLVEEDDVKHEAHAGLPSKCLLCCEMEARRKITEEMDQELDPVLTMHA